MKNTPHDSVTPVWLHVSRFGRLTLISVIGLLIAHPSFAQSGSDSVNETAADSPYKLENFTVTATKRETPLTETPLAVSLVTQDSISREKIFNFKDLQGEIPGLIAAENGRNGALQLSLRGVYSSNDTEFGAPTVGIHLDGVYLPLPSAGLAGLQDVERVEVLRGPQGTIFGRNSTVGTVNVLTRRPDLSTLGGLVEYGRGNYNAETLRLTANLPLVKDHLAVRFNYAQDTRDGWVDQRYDLADFDGDGRPNVDQRRNYPVGRRDFYYNRNANQWRAGLLFKPWDRAKLYVVFDQSIDHSAGSVALKDLSLARGTPAQSSSTGRFDPLLVNVPGDRRGNDQVLRSVLDADLTRWLSMQYTFGYQKLSHNPRTDVDAGQGRSTPWTGLYNAAGAPIFYSKFAEDRVLEFDDTHFNVTSHELQFKSNEQLRTKWIVGGYSSKQTGQMHQINEEPTSYGFNTADVINGPFAYNFRTDGIDIRSKATFAQLEYELAKNLRLTLGFRTTWDHIGYGYQAAYTNSNPIDPSLYFNPPLARPADGGQWYEASDFTSATRAFSDYPIAEDSNGAAFEYKKSTWRVGLDYKLPNHPDTFVYAYAASGYKAGNLPIIIPKHFLNFTPVDFYNFIANPEEVRTYELGLKGTYLDKRLQLKAAAYYSDYKNYQLFEFINIDLIFQVGTAAAPTTLFTVPIRPLVTQNVGSVEMKGLEIEYSYLPWENGRISGNFVSEENHISDFNPVAYSQNWFSNIRNSRSDLTPATGTSLEGNRLPRTPKFAASLRYEHDLHYRGYAIQPSATLNYTSSFFNNITNFAEKEFSSVTKSETLINANVRVTPKNRKYHIDVWVRNLTNKQHMVGQNVGPAQAGQAGDLGFVVGEFTDPRMYGITAGFTF